MKFAREREERKSEREEKRVNLFAEEREDRRRSLLGKISNAFSYNSV